MEDIKFSIRENEPHQAELSLTDEERAEYEAAQSKNYDGMLASCSNLIRLNHLLKRHPGVLILIMQAHYGLENFRASLHAAEQYLQVMLEIDAATALKVAIRSCYQLQRYNELIGFAERYFTFNEINQNNTEIAGMTAHAYFSIGNEVRAFEYCQKILTIDPDNLIALYLLRQIHIAEGTYEIAHEYRERILAVEKTGRDGIFGLFDPHGGMVDLARRREIARIDSAASTHPK